MRYENKLRDDSWSNECLNLIRDNLFYKKGKLCGFTPASKAVEKEFNIVVKPDALRMRVLQNHEYKKFFDENPVPDEKCGKITSKILEVEPVSQERTKIQKEILKEFKFLEENPRSSIFIEDGKIKIGDFEISGKNMTIII